jgi:hypothetical protein
MVETELTIVDADQEDSSRKRSNLLSARWSSPWIVMLLVCAAGAGDGALRAVCILTVGICVGRDQSISKCLVSFSNRHFQQYFNLPTTILGESVRESSLTATDEFTMDLIQV